MILLIDNYESFTYNLYQYLCETKPGLLGSKKIKWNFTKFLVDQKGNVVSRFAPNTKPEDIEKEIKAII